MIIIPQGQVQAHRVEIVACIFFATPNSLKSQRPQKVLSPYSNTHAVTPKLYSFSSHLIAIPRLGARFNSP